MRGGRWGRPVHAGRLDRWLGSDQTERISRAMADWYGSPIPVGNVPGRVFAHRGGDFSGAVLGGGFASLADLAVERIVTARQMLARRLMRWSERQRVVLNAGFSSLSDLIAEATAGKKRDFMFIKTSGTEVVSSGYSLWRLAAVPPAGSAGAAAPGGTAQVDSDTGAPTFTNPTGGDTQHIVRADYLSSVISKTLLLYDRIYSVAKTASSSSAESVTGVPTRYQGSAGAVDGADNNFIFPEVGASNLGATAHNWDAIQYRDQDGTDAQAAASIAGRSGALADSIDLVLGRWFVPLLSGDTGAKDLAQIKVDAVVTGAMNVVIGHPLMWMPCPVANLGFINDGINSAFNLSRIFDDAALALLSIFPAATTATTYQVQAATVAG